METNLGSTGNEGSISTWITFKIELTNSLENSKVKRSKFKKGIQKTFESADVQKVKTLIATVSDKLPTCKLEDIDNYVFSDKQDVKKLTLTPNALELRLTKYAGSLDLYKRLI